MHTFPKAARPVLALVPALALACSDAATSPVVESGPSPALSSGSLSLVSDRPFNTLASSSGDWSGAEGWKTTEHSSPRLTIVTAADAPRSAAQVAEVLLPKGLKGGSDPARATFDFNAAARTVTVDLWNQLSANWEGPRKAASVLFTLNVSGSKRLAVEAQGTGRAKLVPAVSLWGSPDSRKALLPNVVRGAEVTRGQWQHWRVTVRMNTVGRKDGLVVVALDGTTVLRHENVQIVGSGEDWFNLFDWKPRWGGSGDVVPADMSMRWDHVRLHASPDRLIDDSIASDAAPLSGPAPSGPASVAITPEAAAAAVGSTYQFSVTAQDGEGDAVAEAPMQWNSSDTTIATVTATGLATARKAGVALLIATSGSVSDTAQFTVTDASAGPADAGPRTGYYVSPAGRSANAGTHDSPWDLTTAFSGADGRITAGDTVWVRGGDYRGTFISTLSGTSASPIVVRAYPGERAAIVSNSLTTIPFRVRGQWAWYWGLEVYIDNPQRYQGSGERPNCVYPTAPNNKFINMILHDCQVGMAFYNEARNSELYGSIIYNNGWISPERTHGHGIYTKNDGSTRKVIRENIVFNQMRVGLQLYTDPGSGRLENYQIEGNVFFNNGVLTGTNTSAVNMLLGGNEIVDDVDVLENFTYYSPELAMRSVRIGYGNALMNGRLTFDRNYIVGNGTLAVISDFEQLTFSNNQLIGGGDVVDLNDATRSGYWWSGNIHHRDPGATAWRFSGSRYTFANWKGKTGLADGDMTAGRPTATTVFVRKNEYEAGRANVIVYNWGRQGSVAADLSGVLKPGDQYEIRNVQDFWGTPVVSGTYAGGHVMVPMNGVLPPRPIGDVPHQPVRTGPDFDVFVVLVR